MGNNAVFQKPIYSYELFGNIGYCYKCNGCGKEVSGYHQSKVRGHIWCVNCYKNRQKNNTESKRKIHDKQIVSQTIDNVVEEIRREFPECDYVADWVESFPHPNHFEVKEQTND